MEQVLSLLAKGFLLFSDAIIISPLLFIGFITQGGFFVSKSSHEGSYIWGNASLLVLFTMISSLFLKSLFLIPLNPALGIKGYAFPSGHMLVAVVLYGWLILSYPHRGLRIILGVILAGIGYGLIQQGYHNLSDVVGAVVFGIVTLYGFAKTAAHPPIQKNQARSSFYLIPLAAAMIVFTWLRIGLSHHIEITFLGLVAFYLLWFGLRRFGWTIKNWFLIV